jgi:hypothetical protein
LSGAFFDGETNKRKETAMQTIDEYRFMRNFRGHTLECALRKILARPEYSSMNGIMFECYYNGRIFYDEVWDGSDLVDHPILGCEFTDAYTSVGASGEYLIIVCDAPKSTHGRWASPRFTSYMHRMWLDGEPM